MGLKLVRLLAGSVLLIGVSGTVMGGECEDVLARVQDILEKRKNSYAAGNVPESLSEMPNGVSVFEDPEKPKSINFKKSSSGYCFKIGGRWSNHQIEDQPVTHNGDGVFPDIKAYIFFKSQKVDEIYENLSVGVFVKDEHFMALNVNIDGKASDIFAGSKGKPQIDKVQEFVSNYKRNIIWLDTDNHDFIEVVLCEGPCSNIVKKYINNTKKPSATPKNARNPKHGADAPARGGNPIRTDDNKAESIPTKQKSSDKQREEIKENLRLEIIAELRNEFNAERQEISKNAITNSMASKTAFKFVVKRGNKLMVLERKKLIPQGCIPPKAKHISTLKSLSTFFYKNCVSISGYKILNVKPTIQSGKTPMVTFTLKKLKPDTFTTIQVPVEMKGGSKITNACILTAKIIDNSSNEEIFEGAFESINNNPTKHTFSLILNKSINPITWEGKTLVLERYEGADCQPKGGELRVKLTSTEITYDGVLDLQRRAVLESTLGNALLMLNTIIGENSVNGSDSTTQFYPIDDDEPTRMLYTKIVTESLRKLSGKAKELTVGFRKQNGAVELKDFTKDFENQLPEELADKIVKQASFVDGDFVWNAMLSKLNRNVGNQSDYAYRIFIGQSGLSNKESYCENSPRKDALEEQKGATFIYDFATISNDDNPKESDLKDDLWAFPSKPCDDKYRHIVLFPEAKISGWEKTISRLISTAFESVHQ